ncbi:hypothetical protein GALL_470620 [mine drainage metagenome]|uniref:Uncharacterized protein n=1 Tax=mine drainage metagenome TaxID=410659 RepID=A0A1J5PJF7_9ZZZZ
MRCLTTLLSLSCSVRSCRSFHIRYFVNEKMPRWTCSRTSHFGISRTASLNDCNILATSAPWASFGIESSPAMRSSKLLFKSWSSVGLMMASSSWRLNLKPLRTDWRWSETGTRRMGARCVVSAFSASVHRSKPMAKYSVLAPPSSRPVRAALKIASRFPSSASCWTFARSSLLASASSAISSTGVRPTRLV